MLVLLAITHQCSADWEGTTFRTTCDPSQPWVLCLGEGGDAKLGQYVQTSKPPDSDGLPYPNKCVLCGPGTYQDQVAAYGNMNQADFAYMTHTNQIPLPPPSQWYQDQHVGRVYPFQYPTSLGAPGDSPFPDLPGRILPAQTYSNSYGSSGWVTCQPLNAR
jgi:hypothetical protein